MYDDDSNEAPGTHFVENTQFKNAFEGSLNDDLNKTKLFPILTVTPPSTCLRNF